VQPDISVASTVLVILAVVLTVVVKYYRYTFMWVHVVWQLVLYSFRSPQFICKATLSKSLTCCVIRS